jgi:hypothetical protein
MSRTLAERRLKSIRKITQRMFDDYKLLQRALCRPSELDESLSNPSTDAALVLLGDELQRISDALSQTRKLAMNVRKVLDKRALHEQRQEVSH